MVKGARGTRSEAFAVAARRCDERLDAGTRLVFGSTIVQFSQPRIYAGRHAELVAQAINVAWELNGHNPTCLVIIAFEQHSLWACSRLCRLAHQGHPHLRRRAAISRR